MTTNDERNGKAQAWAAYREAFQNFSRKARFVQDLIETRDLDHHTTDTALLELEKAYALYAERRNALAYLLLPLTARGLVPVTAADSEAYEVQVRRVADLIWEVSGRPPGTADDDWYRAEEIIRSVAAA